MGIAEAIARVGPAREIPLADLADARAHGLVREIGPELEQAYLEGVLAHRLHAGEGTDLTIVYTPMHGVGGPLALEALRRAGFANVHPVPEQLQPDPAFPTVRFPNPEEPGAMDLSRALAERTRADLVLANDPDADRLAVLTREASGELRALTGNEVGVLLGHYLLTQGPRRERPLTMTTIVSSTQLGAIALRLGALYDETLTGFKWIANRALERAAKDGAELVFAYEEALGYTVGTLVRDKDGIGAAAGSCCDLVAALKDQGSSVPEALDSLARRPRRAPDVGADRARGGRGGGDDPVTRRAARPAGGCRRHRHRPVDATGPGATDALIFAGGRDHESIRVAVRPSGTEPKIKCYIEITEPAGRSLAAAREAAAARLAPLRAALQALLAGG